MRAVIMAFVAIVIGCSARGWSHISGVRIVDRDSIVVLGGNKSTFIARTDLTGKRTAWSHELGDIYVVSWDVHDDQVLMSFRDRDTKEYVVELRELSRGAIVWRAVPSRAPFLEFFMTPEVLLVGRPEPSGDRLMAIHRRTGAVLWERPWTQFLNKATSYRHHLIYFDLEESERGWRSIDLRDGTKTKIHEWSDTCRIDETQVFVAEDPDRAGELYLVGYHHGDPRTRTRLPYRPAPSGQRFRLHACATYGDKLVFIVDEGGVKDLVVLARSGETLYRTQLLWPATFEAFRGALPRYVPFVVNRTPEEHIAFVDLETGIVTSTGARAPTSDPRGAPDHWVMLDPKLSDVLKRFDGNTGKIAAVEIDSSPSSLDARDDRIVFVGNDAAIGILDARTLEPIYLRGFKVKPRRSIP